jgi:hypothetical protein
MSYGGYWDKLGDQFEDRWALHQLVLLASPFSDIESLEREPVGVDEKGVDLWVNRKDGTRECHQCKLGIEGKTDWSMAALRKERILEHLQFQVSRDLQRHRYRLVSGTPATVFKRLCDEARDSRDEATFWRDQILPVTKLRQEISKVYEALSLSKDNFSDQQRVWSLLRNSSFTLFRRDEEELRELADRFESRVDHDPLTALQALESWLRGQLRRKIEVKGIAAYLESVGFKLILGETDRFGLGARRLARKRREQGSVLRFEAEVAALQSEIGQNAVDRLQILAGRWRLVRQIGSGGLADVWQGEDQNLREPERELVAVKILRADKANDPILIDRFYKGGKAASRIEDWRIPRILLEPCEADGRHFCVMEYVEGRNLGDWLSKQQLPLAGPQEKVVIRNDPAYGLCAWKIIYSVGEALSFLHSNGLVHGDVKPKNILVSRQGLVKLCDFDLIHIQPIPGASSIVLGTLPYLAPEVMNGQEATALSDQYSLAMTIVSVIQGADLLPGEVPIHLPELLQGLSCSIAVKENLTRALALQTSKRFETIETFMNNLGPEAFGPGS